jgi:hypothetical protein
MGGLMACGGGTAGETAVPAPSSSGRVLVMDLGARTTAAAELLGFVHGLHTIVLDGNRVYAGMTRIDAKEGQNGARTLTLAGGQTADLVPAGEGFELRFSSGETIAMRQQETKTE